MNNRKQIQKQQLQKINKKINFNIAETFPFIYYNNFYITQNYLKLHHIFKYFLYYFYFTSLEFSNFFKF
jgi:hypothetical protein